MGALLRSQALGGGVQPTLNNNAAAGPASGPLSLMARRAGGGGPARPNLGQMGMPPSAPAGLGMRGGLGGRRMGPPGGLTLSGMQGGKKDEGNKFSDFGKIMWVFLYLPNLCEMMDKLTGGKGRFGFITLFVESCFDG